MTGPCLLVDPDPVRRAEISKCVVASGVSLALEGADYAEVECGFQPDLGLSFAIVAVARPLDAGLGLLSRLRVTYPDCVILAIDIADTEDSAARAFHAGAHDVLRVPFRLAEFEIRLTQRLIGQGPQDTAPKLDVDALIELMDLTKAEVRILRYLATQQNRVVTRNELSQHLYGTDWSYRDRRFDVHIGRIRRKLSEVMEGRYTIVTIRSAGYMLRLREDGDP